MASESQKRQSGVSETLDQKRCEALAHSSVRLHPGFGCGFVDGDLLQIQEVASFAIPCAGFRNSMLQEGIYLRCKSQTAMRPFSFMGLE